MGFNLGFTAILPVDHFDFLKRTFISYSKMFKHKNKRGYCETKTVLCYLSGARMIWETLLKISRKLFVKEIFRNLNLLSFTIKVSP